MTESASDLGGSPVQRRMDPEFADALLAFAAEAGLGAPPTSPTIESLREGARLTFPLYGARVPRYDLEKRDIEVTRPDGSIMRMRWYSNRDRLDAAQPSGAALYIHGGGMVSADIDDYDPLVTRYAAESDTPLLSVDYRLAPEHPAPAALHDAVLALDWLHEHAGEMRVDPQRIGVMGDSGGGAVASSLAIFVRDSGRTPLAVQILPYPTLDDRPKTPDPSLVPFLTWTYENHVLVWDAYTGGLTPDESGHVAAARANDLSGLPPCYLDVGELDLLCREVINYAKRLLAAGVPTELHVIPGVPHAFEIVAPHLQVSQQILNARYRALARI